MVGFGSYRLRVADFMLLNKHVWINDEVINGYGSLVNSYSKSTSEKSVLAFHTHILQLHLLRRQYNIFSHSMLFFPTHVSNCHWYLIVVALQKEEIWILDSLFSSSDTGQAKYTLSLEFRDTFISTNLFKERHQFFNKDSERNWRVKVSF